MIRIVGAVLLMAGCAGFGISLASAYRYEMKLLRSLIYALQEMEWELKFRMTDLPDLCRIAADATVGSLKNVFWELADKLDKNEVFEITGCLNGILMRVDLPARVRRNMKQLGRSLGRYDLEGQLQGLQAVRQQCRNDLQTISENSIQRMRSYQILALCAGASLVIIFI